VALDGATTGALGASKGAVAAVEAGTSDAETLNAAAAINGKNSIVIFQSSKMQLSHTPDRIILPLCKYT
jgi:hypothetical protein